VIGVSIVDRDDGVEYSLSFSEEDARNAVIDWGRQKVDLPSIGGSIQISKGIASIMYSNGENQVGLISCDHQDLIDQLKNSDDSFEEEL
jgi:hypothetical protein